MTHRRSFRRVNAHSKRVLLTVALIPHSAWANFDRIVSRSHPPHPAVVLRGLINYCIMARFFPPVVHIETCPSDWSIRVYRFRWPPYPAARALLDTWVTEGGYDSRSEAMRSLLIWLETQPRIRVKHGEVKYGGH